MISTKCITVPDIMPLVRHYYTLPGNNVGGNLHIVLDDGNIQDDHIKFCLDKCLEDGDLPGEALCRLLLRMTFTQRTKIYKGVYG